MSKKLVTIIIFLLALIMVPKFLKANFYPYPLVSTLDAEQISDTSVLLKGKGRRADASPPLRTIAYFRISEMDIAPIYCNDIYGPDMISTPDIVINDPSWPTGWNLNWWNFAQEVHGLKPATTYYYCAIVSDENNIGYGFQDNNNVKSFTTLPCQTCDDVEIETRDAKYLYPESATLKGWYSSTRPIKTYFEFRPCIPCDPEPWNDTVNQIIVVPFDDWEVVGTRNYNANTSGGLSYKLTSSDVHRWDNLRVNKNIPIRFFEFRAVGEAEIQVLEDLELQTFYGNILTFELPESTFSGVVDINDDEFDVCSNIPDVQNDAPPGMVVTVDGQCVEVDGPTDLCLNIEGNQSVVPIGMELIGGDCVEKYDACPNLSGTQSSVPNNYVVNANGDCVYDFQPPDDVCPNIDGVQPFLPPFHEYDENGDCINTGFPVPDACPNMEGNQFMVPFGYKKVNGECVAIDYCTNLEGNQFPKPFGYIIEGGECTPDPYNFNYNPTDACQNLEGLQIGVPYSFERVNGDCIPIDLCPNITGDQYPKPFGYIIVDENCVEDPYVFNYNPYDACSNIPGNQPATPYGNYRVSGECFPLDLCPNLSGDQYPIPFGNILFEGNCILDPNGPGGSGGVPTGEPTDYCPNLEGVQIGVPYGFEVLNGSCLPMDLCPNLPDDQYPIPFGYVMENDICVQSPYSYTGEPVDSCPNLNGTQLGVPYGYEKINGQCFAIDFCPNISGNQYPVPFGYIIEDGDCVDDPSVFDGSGGIGTGIDTTIGDPVDRCPNISGTQIAVPYGYEKSNGDCIPIDLCPNLLGDQYPVPAGMIIENGNCVDDPYFSNPGGSFVSPFDPSTYDPFANFDFGFGNIGGIGSLFPGFDFANLFFGGSNPFGGGGNPFGGESGGVTFNGITGVGNFTGSWNGSGFAGVWNGTGIVGPDGNPFNGSIGGTFIGPDGQVGTFSGTVIDGIGTGTWTGVGWNQGTGVIDGSWIGSNPFTGTGNTGGTEEVYIFNNISGIGNFVGEFNGTNWGGTWTGVGIMDASGNTINGSVSGTFIGPDGQSGNFTGIVVDGVGEGTWTGTGWNEGAFINAIWIGSLGTGSGAGAGGGNTGILNNNVIVFDDFTGIGNYTGNCSGNSCTGTWMGTGLFDENGNPLVGNVSGTFVTENGLVGTFTGTCEDGGDSYLFVGLDSNVCEGTWVLPDFLTAGIPPGNISGTWVGGFGSGANNTGNTGNLNSNVLIFNNISGVGNWNGVCDASGSCTGSWSGVGVLNMGGVAINGPVSGTWTGPSGQTGNFSGTCTNGICTGSWTGTGWGVGNISGTWVGSEGTGANQTGNTGNLIDNLITFNNISGIGNWSGVCADGTCGGTWIGTNVLDSNGNPINGSVSGTWTGPNGQTGTFTGTCSDSVCAGNWTGTGWETGEISGTWVGSNGTGINPSGGSGTGNTGSIFDNNFVFNNFTGIGNYTGNCTGNNCTGTWSGTGILDPNGNPIIGNVSGTFVHESGLMGTFNGFCTDSGDSFLFVGLDSNVCEGTWILPDFTSANIPPGGISGTWVGSGGTGSNQTGNTGNLNSNLIVFNNISGIGVWSGTCNSSGSCTGNWTGVGVLNSSGLPVNGPISGTWTGPDGQTGNFTGTCTNGTCTGAWTGTGWGVGEVSGTWVGSNGTGANPGGIYTGNLFDNTLIYNNISGIGNWSGICNNEGSCTGTWTGVGMLDPNGNPLNGPVSGSWTGANGEVGTFTGTCVDGVCTGTWTGTGWAPGEISGTWVGSNGTGVNPGGFNTGALNNTVVLNNISGIGNWSGTCNSSGSCTGQWVGVGILDENGNPITGNITSTWVGPNGEVGTFTGFCVNGVCSGTWTGTGFPPGNVSGSWIGSNGTGSHPVPKGVVDDLIQDKVMVLEGVTGIGNFTGTCTSSGCSGTWSGIDILDENGNPINGAVSGTWFGPSGEAGTFVGTCVDGVCTGTWTGTGWPTGEVNGIWMGENGNGANGEIDAPTKMFLGIGGTSSGTWTSSEGGGTWREIEGDGKNISMGIWSDGKGSWGTWKGTWINGTGIGTWVDNNGRSGSWIGTVESITLDDTVIPMSDAIVRYHEGIEHVFIRQIVVDKNLARRYGYKEGQNLQRFAEELAHSLAKQFSYIDKNGVEIRVIPPDVAAYQFQVVGNRLIVYEIFQNKLIGIRNITSVFKSKYSYEYYYSKK